MWIGGQWVESISGQLYELTSPVDGQVLASVPKGDRRDVHRAVDAARKAFESFRRFPPFDRRKLLLAVAEVLERRRAQVARQLTLEQGKPYHQEALPEVDITAEMFRMAAEDLVRLDGHLVPSRDASKRIITFRQPRGVYGVITPWNFPLSIPAEYLSAGLAAGNCIVWVPAPAASSTAVRLAECLAEAGVPEGVVNLVTGPGEEVGDELAGHPGVDAIGFTGSSSTGYQVAARASGKPQLLELGGNAAVIVFEDADLAHAAERVAQGSFANAGQICDSVERILVQRSVAERFTEALVKEAGRFRLGDPFDPATTLGPLSNPRGLMRVRHHVADAVQRGARLLLGGASAPGFPTDLYFPPTILDQVTPEMLVNREESFGPVAPVLIFDDESQALQVANGTPWGLVGAVFTRDLARAFRVAEEMQCGVVNVNESSAYWEPHTPFGGFTGRKSGLGRLGGRCTIEEMSQIKTVVLDLGYHSAPGL